MWVVKGSRWDTGGAAEQYRGIQIVNIQAYPYGCDSGSPDQPSGCTEYHPSSQRPHALVYLWIQNVNTVPVP